MTRCVLLPTRASITAERIMHQPYDYASDVWSLGLVLLECALGHYPYPEPRAQIAMVMILTEGDIPLPPRECDNKNKSDSVCPRSHAANTPSCCAGGCR